jgi:hypothetical protein
MKEATHSRSAPRPGWNLPKPDVIPRPTWWPAATALGIALFAWGLITSSVILVIGAGLLTTSIAGWIGEIRHERNQG